MANANAHHRGSKRTRRLAFRFSVHVCFLCGELSLPTAYCFHAPSRAVEVDAKRRQAGTVRTEARFERIQSRVPAGDHPTSACPRAAEGEKLDVSDVGECFRPQRRFDDAEQRTLANPSAISAGSRRRRPDVDDACPRETDGRVAVVLHIEVRLVRDRQITSRPSRPLPGRRARGAKAGRLMSAATVPERSRPIRPSACRATARCPARAR